MSNLPEEYNTYGEDGDAFGAEEFDQDEIDGGIRDDVRNN
jgi:hypothetical protein